MLNRLSSTKELGKSHASDHQTELILSLSWVTSPHQVIIYPIQLQREYVPPVAVADPVWLMAPLPTLPDLKVPPMTTGK